MNKLLVITVLVALLAFSAESFRMPRQVDAEAEAEAVEEKGTITKITDTIKSYYNNAVDSVTDGLESIKGLKLEEKAQNFFTETKTIFATYFGILNDQAYHTFYSQ